MLALAGGGALLVGLAVVALSIGHYSGAPKMAVRVATAPGAMTSAGAELTPGVIYAASFPDVAGKSQVLGQWQHDLLVINFWATWCAPCKEEMPVFAELQQKYVADGVKFIGIAADTPSNVANFVQKTPTGYPLLPDEARAIEFSKRLGNRLGLLPHTVVVAPGGNIIYAKLGVVQKAEFEAILQKNKPKTH
jgi:thiol-disulfide isomerase/thioredoxin